MFDEYMKEAIKKDFGLEFSEAQKKVSEILKSVGFNEAALKRRIDDSEFLYSVLDSPERVKELAKSVDLGSEYGASVLYMALCP